MQPGRLTILGGRGALPIEVLSAALGSGWAVQYLSFESRDDLPEGDFAQRSISIGKPLDIAFVIRKFSTTHICMAGGIDLTDKNRRNLLSLVPTIGKKKSKAPTGDSGLAKFSKAAELLTGAKLAGAHEIVPGLLAGAGSIAGPKANKSLIADGRHAIERAISAGALDLGQALVCSGPRVVALEDIGGTDLLLERVGAFVKRGLVGDAGNPLVLAKARKPGQPTFADLPAIGPDTITSAATAGISAIFVEAGHSIVIGRTELEARAKKKAISVHGIETDAL